MLKYHTHKLLNEALGFSLGVHTPQTLGLHSNGPSPVSPGGEPAPDAVPPDEGEEGGEGGEGGDDVELTPEDIAKIPPEVLEKLKAMGVVPDDAEGEEEGDDDVEANHDDDLGDDDGQDDLPAMKRPDTPFMKKEAAEEDKGGPTFMMKKCGSGMCGKGCKGCKCCSANMRKEGTEYSRPSTPKWTKRSFRDSLEEMLGMANINRRWSDGVKREDILIPPADGQVEAPKPGEPGFAPQTRIGG